MLPADAFEPVVRKLDGILRDHGIRYHMTGGITSVVYGEPRLTQDLDLVLDRDGTAKAGESFFRALAAAGFQFGEESARRAIASRGMFQLFDEVQLLKVDLYVRSLIPGELDRSVAHELFEGTMVPIVSREDAALSKLIWIREGSHRSRRDLRRIVAGASTSERAAIEARATAMGLAELLAEVLRESDEIDL